MKQFNNLVRIFFLSAILLSKVSAQSPPALPTIMPPPADAASLGKYADVPVNMSTGMPNISVPIYTIKTPRLEVPINISYYASGIKVDDIASWVGLGWSLNAGGAITRTIKGLDDLSPGKGYIYHNLPLGDTLTPMYSWAYMDSVMFNYIDAQPDYFFYNFNNSSGKFIFGQTKQPICIEYTEPLKIQFNQDSSSFTILDGSGNQYLFGAKESTTSYVSSSSGPTHNQTYTSSWYLSSIISFDKSDSIIFKYYTDNTLYQTFDSYSETVGPQYSCVPAINGSLVLTEGSPAAQSGQDDITSESFLNSNPLRLQEIDFKNGKVIFYSSESRTDVPEARLDSATVFHYDPEFSSYDVLKRVKLSYDYFVSNYNVTWPSSVTDTGSRLRLDSVKYLGANNENGGKYTFLYDSTMLPIVGSNGRDLFNYYNGAVNNPTLVPFDTVDYGGGGSIFYLGGANRAVNPSYIQAGILKHIYYPTGGRSDFTYEPNQYQGTYIYNLSGSASAQARGYSTQQMGQIGETDTVTFEVPANSGPATYTSVISPYNYPHISIRPYDSFTDLTTNTVIYQQLDPSPTAGENVTYSTDLAPGHTYQLIADAYQSDSIYATISVSWQAYDTSRNVSTMGAGLRIKQISHFDQSGQFSKSEAYKYGTAESGYGYLPSPTWQFNTFTQTVYINYTCGGTSYTNGYNCGGVSYTAIQANANSIYDVFNLSSAPLSYPEVAEYRMDSLGNNTGKSVYDFTVNQNGQLPVSQYYNTGIYITNGSAGGRMISQADYVNKSGTYWPVRRTYIGIKDSALQQGRGVITNLNYNVQGACTIQGADGTPGPYSFDYPINTEAVYTVSNTVYNYSQNDTTKFVTESTNYGYDNLDHLQPTVVVRTTSNGTVLTTTNRYPEEADSISGLPGSEMAAFDTLVSRHNITTLIQSQTVRDSLPVNLLRMDYALWSGSLDLPDSIEYQTGSFPMEKRIQFYGYDNYGNIQEDGKASDIFQSYLWDYHNAYPIAQVANAGISDIAYTSFEADGSGNWTIPGTSRSDTAFTGKLSYALTGSNSISKSGLNSSTTYIIGYWTYNGKTSITVNGSASTPETTIGNWTYCEAQVSGVTSVTVGGIGTIDELRLYPKGALMTTFTYEPLVGLTSQCDPTGKIIYYTYDGLGRLHMIQDQYGNILKRYDYEYQTSNQ